jgi:hypothetical protein
MQEGYDKPRTVNPLRLTAIAAMQHNHFIRIVTIIVQYTDFSRAFSTTNPLYVVVYIHRPGRYMDNLLFYKSAKIFPFSPVGGVAMLRTLKLHQ